METLVAYAFHRPDSAARAAEGAARVEAYYADSAAHWGHDGRTNGLHLWGTGDTLWPAWHQTGNVRVASLHTPVGYERVVGDITPADAPGPLAEAVRRTPEAFIDLAPPFTMAVLEDDRLDLFTDSAGLGQLFQVRLPDGWVWSNRPVAALLFAGVAAAASPRGWAFAAACGWFMGDSTPYEGVLAVPGATHIVADGNLRRQTTSRIEPSTLWLTDALEEPLPDLSDSVRRLQPAGPPVPPKARPEQQSLVERALSWHRYAEGLGSADDLYNTPPTVDHDLTVAYGHYYPADLVAVDTLPLHAKLQIFTHHLETVLVPAAGPSEAARAAVAIQIEQVLRDAVRGGIEDATMLDYFYLTEPLRRRTTPANHPTALPLTPHHIRAALTNPTPTNHPSPWNSPPGQLQPGQSQAGQPQARQPESQQRQPRSLRPRQPRPRRLGDAPDRDLIATMLLDVDGFDERALSTLWAASVAGASTAAAEVILRRALWRATFDLHLTEVNNHLPELIRPLTAPPRALPPPQPTPKPRRTRLIPTFARRHHH
ncbi:hypothetical protein ACFCV3_18175 [Kribbella sp. NPDC056345]|uniref:hypothetical protein n=1 Tax=Kribbella sp. NPDC056345 TaxID=3345789 RepID=UPI0035DC6648